MRPDLASTLSESRSYLLPYCRRMLGDDDAAEDAVQMTWIKLAQAWPLLDFQNADGMKGYIYTTAHNTVVDMQRRSSRHLREWQSAVTAHKGMVSPDVAETVVMNESLRHAFGLMNRLSKRERAIMMLYIQGYNSTESIPLLAGELGTVTVPAIKGAVHRAHARLRNERKAAMLR